MSRPSIVIVPCIAFLACIFTPPSFGQSPAKNRIREAIESTSRVALHGNVHPLVRPEFDQGPVEGSLRLEDVTVVFSLTPAQQSDLKTLLDQQLNPDSPDFHQWLTPEQYADRFGLSPSDLEAVAGWLETQGLTVTQTARGGGWISFSGLAADVEAAFHTEIHRYIVNGQTYFANATNPELPSALARVVLGFRGLNNYRPKPMHVVRQLTAGSTPNFTSYLSGGNFLAPGDFATIYDVNALYSSGIDGTGQTIAVVGQTDFPMSDISTFRSLAGLPANNPTVLLIPGSADPGSTSTPDVTEADLDLEWSGAMAKNATVIFVNSTDAYDSLQYAIDQNLAAVISISYGACEQDMSTAQMNTLESMIQQANSEGITVVASSGDEGAAGCDLSSATSPIQAATHGLAVEVPSSLPNVTAMGGSEFNEGSGTYWQSLPAFPRADITPSALSYIPEKAWNDTSSTNGLLAGGGGPSAIFAKPSWQSGVTPNDNARDVPDLALSASPEHDGYLLCVQGSCVNGYRQNNAAQNLTVAGGTSVAAPTFAAIVALIVQKTGSRQGNINPTLYAMAANSPGAFHEITLGNNIVPCRPGTPNCPASAPYQFGFSASAGYNQVTGLGSVDALNLATAWNVSSSKDLPAPSLVTPAAGATGVVPSPTFTWTAVDGNAGYRILIATTAAALPTSASMVACSACTVVDATGPNVASYTATIPLAAGTYYWEVQAINPDNGTAAWSAVSSFASIGGPLAAATLTAPGNGATAVPLPPTFTWTSISGSAGYQILIANSPVGLPTNPSSTACGSCVVNTTTASTSYTPAASTLAGGTTYFWQAQAVASSGGGQTALWSGVSSFATAPSDFSLATAPGTMTLIRGSSGIANVTLTPINNFSGSVTLTCSVPGTLPGVTCSVGPLNGNNVATVTLIASSTARGFPATQRINRYGDGRVALLGLALLLMVLRNRQRARPEGQRIVYRQAALEILLASLLVANISCGGGSGGGATNSPAPESGSVIIQATSSSLSHSVSLTVNVS